MDGETKTFSPYLWYFILKTSTWPWAKKKEWHSPKTKQRQLKLFTPLYTCYQSILKKFQIWIPFTNQRLWPANIFHFFGKWKKVQGNLTKHIAYVFNCSHPFYLLWIRSKKFTALNYTNKRMTLACQFRALLPDSE